MMRIWEDANQCAEEQWLQSFGTCYAHRPGDGGCHLLHSPSERWLSLLKWAFFCAGKTWCHLLHSPSGRWRRQTVSSGGPASSTPLTPYMSLCRRTLSTESAAGSWSLAGEWASFVLRFFSILYQVLYAYCDNPWYLLFPTLSYLLFSWSILLKYWFIKVKTDVASPFSCLLMVMFISILAGWWFVKENCHLLRH